MWVQESFIKIKLFFRFMGRYQKNAKKIFLIPLGLVRQHNSPKPYCSPSIIIQGNFHLSKHPRERFYRFYKNGANNQDNVLLLFKGENTPLEDKGKLICKRTSVPPPCISVR